jgi:hypothetical protein
MRRTPAGPIEYGFDGSGFLGVSRPQLCFDDAGLNVFGSIDNFV